jgi:hypothetical protein
MNLYPLDRKYKSKLRKSLGLSQKEIENLTLEDIEKKIIEHKKIKKLKPLIPTEHWLIGRGNVFIYLREFISESWLVRQIAKL